MIEQPDNSLHCTHIVERLVSKDGDAPEWIYESAWRHFDGTRERCELCGFIRLYHWAQTLID